MISDHQERLARMLAATARGPKRNAIYAIWLVLRLCEDLKPPDSINSRANRKRVAALKQRLSSLSLPVVVVRTLSQSLEQLALGTPEGVLEALGELTTAARMAVGPECGDLIADSAWGFEQALNGIR